MIKAHEGQKVSNAMINALVAQEIQRQKTIRESELEAEVDTLRRELEIRKRQDAEIYALFVQEQKEHSILKSVWWALVGWTVLGIGALVDMLRGLYAV